MILGRVRALLVAAAVGVGLGAFSLLADGVVRSRLGEILGNLASPWGLAAFAVGWLASTRRLGVLAGAMALLVGVVTYYSVGAATGYVVGAGGLIFVVTAVVIGPVMGFSGAAVSGSLGRRPVLAVAAPSVILLAEAVFFVIDRRIWLSDFSREPYRLIDLGIVVAFIAVAMLLPPLFAVDRSHLRLCYAIIVTGGLVGAGGLILLYRLIALVA